LHFIPNVNTIFKIFKTEVKSMNADMHTEHQVPRCPVELAHDAAVFLRKFIIYTIV
jgi:hypothetical protein